MLESTRGALGVPLPTPRADAALAGREVVDLGPVDVVPVACQGAVEVRLIGRDGAKGASIEILPVGADTFVVQCAHLVKGIPEPMRDPAPDPIVRPDDHPILIEDMGEVAGFQVRQTGDGFEMWWATVEGWRAVRCTITFGQLVALANGVQATLEAMSDVEKKSRLVDLTKWGYARQIRGADGAAPVSAFIKLPTSEPEAKLPGTKDEGPGTMPSPSHDCPCPGVVADGGWLA